MLMIIRYLTLNTMELKLICQMVVNSRHSSRKSSIEIKQYVLLRNTLYSMRQKNLKLPKLTLATRGSKVQVIQLAEIQLNEEELRKTVPTLTSNL